jgi:deoxyguanosine kinase
MQRIASRDRPYERNMEYAYIDQLNRAYDNFFSRSRVGTPSLTIETNDLDFVRSPEDLKWVENRIRQALKLVPFQQELPLGFGAKEAAGSAAGQGKDLSSKR